MPLFSFTSRESGGVSFRAARLGHRALPLLAPPRGGRKQVDAPCLVYRITAHACRGASNCNCRPWSYSRTRCICRRHGHGDVSRSANSCNCRMMYSRRIRIVRSYQRVHASRGANCYMNRMMYIRNSGTLWPLRLLPSMSP